MTRDANSQLSVAIHSGDIEEWGDYRALRNLASKICYHAKQEFYTNVLNKTETTWRNIKLITTDYSSSLLQCIIHEELIYTSVKKIVSIRNLFFKTMIEDICNKFKDSKLEQSEYCQH